ncbi:MAG TPA: hypothetical protein PLE80_11710 [Opitutaceae bacterium]|jgi:hypothetical protein|nr:hypothetical protein [Opitutaceae bacterium]
MKRLLPALFAVLPLVAEPVITESADASGPAQPAAAVKSEPAAAPAVEVSGPTHRVSSTMASAITAKLPKYAPPPPPPPEPEYDETNEDPNGVEIDDPEDTATDRPKNKIIRLPKYVIIGERPPVFRERDVYTKQGLAAVAMKRYLSGLDRGLLNRFTLPLIGTSSAARAMQIYEEDVRLQNISDFQSAANDAERAGDKAEADYIRKETNETYLRSGGMNWNSRESR